MAYSVQTDLNKRFGASEIAQLIAQGHNIDVVIADADAKIDSFLRGLYTVPIVTPPSEIVQVSCDIARYFLYDNAASEEVRLRYEDAIKWLTMISKGIVSLNIPSKEEVLTGGLIVKAREQVYSDELNDKMIDPKESLGL